MNQVNYQKELEKILNTLQEKGEAASDYRPPRLFLHSCCAPCSSYCLEYLCRYFLITVFYYNPNLFGRIPKARGGAEASDRRL